MTPLVLRELQCHDPDSGERQSCFVAVGYPTKTGRSDGVNFATCPLVSNFNGEVEESEATGVDEFQALMFAMLRAAQIFAQWEKRTTLKWPDESPYVVDQDIVFSGLWQFLKDGLEQLPTRRRS